jgi:hypothetical protein
MITRWKTRDKEYDKMRQGRLDFKKITKTNRNESPKAEEPLNARRKLEYKWAAYNLDRKWRIMKHS